MTIEGVIVMIVSVGGMTGFLLWCVIKVLSIPGSEDHLHAQADIQPPDIDDTQDF